MHLDGNLGKDLVALCRFCLSVYVLYSQDVVDEFYWIRCDCHLFPEGCVSGGSSINCSCLPVSFVHINLVGRVN